MSALAPTLQAFFTTRLISQRQVSSHTIASYRDTFRLLFTFVSKRIGKQPSQLEFQDLDAPLVAAFLDYLQTDRNNSIRTRNTRLAAIRSFFRYAALQHPEYADSIRRVLAIPPKRFERNLVTYLTEVEVDALLNACDRRSWTGRRDYAMLVLAIQTGLRISEITGLTCGDLTLRSPGAHVHCLGKGRKERITPLLPSIIAVLQVWCDERQGDPLDPLFPTSTGKPLSRDAVERRIKLYVVKAATECSSLKSKRVSAHTLRHTAAMRLLLSDVDITVIALWLGHEQVATTQIYLHADMTQKERAIARVTPPTTTPGRYRPPDTMLAFLEGL
ncbi:putative integrase/recombinase [Leifsonia rubra CMS 76R]|nr:putative integrase/recombinase [Leifsonia rubra CMS 76R]